MQMIDSARTVLAGTAQQQAVWIKSTALERRTAGIYHYRIYNSLGRFVLSLRESAKFLILGLALTVIPGEAVFYGLFFLLFVPYELYMCWRLRIVSHALTGHCPLCDDSLYIELQREDMQTFWKYCPRCGGALEISRQHA